MIEIIPAIMPDDIDDLTAQMARVKGLVPLVQIDVMDGVFVPPTTWPYTPEGAAELAAFSVEDEGFPYWKELDFEVDLMIADPLSVLDDWAQAGARRIIVHIESVADLSTVVERLNGFNRVDAGVEVGAVEFGVALNPDTDPKTLEPHLDAFDFVQCMGIARIGYMGEPLDERVLSTIAALKEMDPAITISVDGGVHFDTAPQLVKAGATRLISGSAVMKADDPKEALAQFERVVA